MSNYFLCDACDGKVADAPHHTVFCSALYCGAIAVPKCVMFDHHGRGGKRYDDPTDVCRHYHRERSEP